MQCEFQPVAHWRGKANFVSLIRQNYYIYAHFAPQASQALVAWLLGTSPRISHWRNLDSVIFQHFYEGSWVRVLKKQYYPFCDSPGPSVYKWTRRSRMATSYCFAISLNLPVQTLLCPKLPSGCVRSYHLAEVLVRKSTRKCGKKTTEPKGMVVQQPPVLSWSILQSGVLSLWIK